MKERIKKLSIGRLIVRLVLIINTVFVVLPLLWSLLTSFKTTTEFYNNPWTLPSGLFIENYLNAFGKANMGDYFLNSLFVTALGLVLSLTFSTASAYVLSRYEFKFRNLIKKVYMVGLFLPPIFGLVPLFMLLRKLGLFDSLIGLSMVYAFTSIPYTVFILSSYFTSIPKEYEEAAIIDGCSYFGVLLRIMVPIARPAIFTVSIFNFMAFWNEYIYALTYITTESKRTLPIGLINLMEVQRYSTDWGALFAGLVIVMVPTLLVYAFLQKHITSGLTVGGLKG